MMLRPRYLIVSALLALPLCGVSVQAQQANGLQQRMSGAEFKAAGLDQLSPQQLENLDRWLNSHGKAATRVVDASGEPVFYTDSKKRSTINARIVGQFDGWSGHNRVTLDNGQQWQQIGSDQPACRRIENPTAKVKPSLFGNWLMYVQGCNDMVHVKRLK